MMLSTHNTANTAHISAKRMFVFCIFVIHLIFFAFAYVTTDTIAIKKAKYFFIFITVYLDLFISR